MCTSALWFMCVSLLFSKSLSCYQCFVNVEDSFRLCWGHILTEHNVRNVDSCFRMLDHIFNNNQRVIQAGRVGADKLSFKLFNIMFWICVQSKHIKIRKSSLSNNLKPITEIMSQSGSWLVCNMSFFQVKAMTNSWRRFWMQRSCPWHRSSTKSWIRVAKHLHW